MTYSSGGVIQATDYNTFASSLNEIYGDISSGATSLPAAQYGYGQGNISGVSAGASVGASEWSSLFDKMRNTGTHQGTSVIPPVPSSGPISGDIITAFNTPAMSTALANLKTNSLNIAAGQYTYTPDSLSQTSGAWLNSLQFTCQYTFSSWDAMRYFFNAGGSLSLSASYSPVSTPDDSSWVTMYSTFGTRIIYATSSNTSLPSIGFYGLTSSPVVLYTGFGPSGPYSASYMQFQAWLNNAPGSATSVIFRVTMVDNDSGSPTYKQTKAGISTFNAANTCSTGNVTTAAPSVGSVTWVNS